MRITQTGVSGVIALLGTTITQTQLTWLARAPAVLLLMDADQAGRTGATSIARALGRQTTVLIHHLPPEHEPEDLSDADLLALLGNAFPFSLNPHPPSSLKHRNHTMLKNKCLTLHGIFIDTRL
jgi:DNA primase